MIDKELDRLERKLKIENLERCLNCELFCKCELRKEEIVVCDRFKELNVKKQLIVVSLEEYSRLKGVKNQATLCSF